MSFEKSLNISKSSPKAVNKMTENTMAKREKNQNTQQKTIDWATRITLTTKGEIGYSKSNL